MRFIFLTVVVLCFSNGLSADVFDHEIQVKEFGKSGASLRVPSLWYMEDGSLIDFFYVGGAINGHSGAFNLLEEHILEGKPFSRNLGPEKGLQQLNLINSVLPEKINYASPSNGDSKVIYVITDSPNMKCPPCDAHLPFARKLMKFDETIDIHVIRVVE